MGTLMVTRVLMGPEDASLAIESCPVRLSFRLVPASRLTLLLRGAQS